MRNKRQVILDFTSLVDVIMLILFFFVIFAQFDSAAAIERAESAQAEAEERSAEAERQRSEAESAYNEAEERLSELRMDEARANAVLLNGGGDFERAVRVQLELIRSDSGEWYIAATSEDNEVRVISDVRNREPSVLADELDAIISGYGCLTSDAVLVNFVYDSEVSGSRRAKMNSDDMLRILTEEHGYGFLFSTTVDTCRKFAADKP